MWNNLQAIDDIYGMYMYIYDGTNKAPGRDKIVLVYLFVFVGRWGRYIYLYKLQTTS